MAHHNASGILKWVEIEDGLEHHSLHHELAINVDLNGYVPAPVPFTSLIPVGSVNGLICISELGDKDGVEVDNVYICNPMTREYLTLPRPQNQKDGLVGYKFGVNSLTGEYKVLRVSGLIPDWPILLEAEVYTLGTSQWRSLGQVPCRIHGFRGPFLNYCFHWEVYHQDAPVSTITFDLDKETFQLFPSPPTELEGIVKWSEHLGVFKGCLCKSRTHNSQITIWVMKQYGIKESWHKELVITQPVYAGRDWLRMMYVYGVLQDGSILMVVGNNVLAYCPKSKTIEKLAILSYQRIVLTHRPSFIKLEDIDSDRVHTFKCQVR